MSQNEEARIRQMSREEDDLRKAIRLSEEEDARRKREQEDSNATALFDDGNQL